MNKPNELEPGAKLKLFSCKKRKLNDNVIDGHMSILILFFVQHQIGWWTSIYAIIIQSSILWKQSHSHINRNIKLINDVNGIEHLWRHTISVSNKNAAFINKSIKLDSKLNPKSIFCPILYFICYTTIVHCTSISPTIDSSDVAFYPDCLANGLCSTMNRQQTHLEHCLYQNIILLCSFGSIRFSWFMARLDLLSWQVDISSA